MKTHQEKLQAVTEAICKCVPQPLISKKHFGKGTIYAGKHQKCGLLIKREPKDNTQVLFYQSLVDFIAKKDEENKRHLAV